MSSLLSFTYLDSQLHHSRPHRWAIHHTANLKGCTGWYHSDMQTALGYSGALGKKKKVVLFYSCKSIHINHPSRKVSLKCNRQNLWITQSVKNCFISDHFCVLNCTFVVLIHRRASFQSLGNNSLRHP